MRLSAGALAFVLLLIGRSEALAHATLKSSEPKAGERVSRSPPRIRLVFTEPVLAELSQIELLSTGAPGVRLNVRSDPHDVHALLASPGLLAAGAYRVIWRIVSADGHPVDGSFVFSVGVEPSMVTAIPPLPGRAEQMGHQDASGPTFVGAPIIPSLLRGAGLAAMLALTGLLTFALRSEGVGGPPSRATRLMTWLAVAAPILLAAHFTMWLVHAAPPGDLSRSWLQTVMTSTVGRMEGVRVGLAALTLWALALARRPAIAQFLAGTCLIVSGAIGHSAAIAPAVAIPSKALHLLAIAIWLGGLLWLIVADREDRASFTRDCHRVSALALWAVIAVSVTGALQSFLFVGGLSTSLWLSAYGAFVAAKIVGLLLLAGFGAYHRLRAMPAVDAGAPVGVLRHSVKREILLLIAVIFIGGVMAYVPTPQRTTIAPTASGGP